MAKSDRYYLPLHRPGDTSRMTDAVTWAEKAGLDPLYRPDAHQLKFGAINFWPNTGRIYVDGGKRCTDRGLDAFKAAVMRAHPRPDTIPDCEHLRDQNACSLGE